jgi:hypothetical protein
MRNYFLRSLRAVPFIVRLFFFAVLVACVGSAAAQLVLPGSGATQQSKPAKASEAGGSYNVDVSGSTGWKDAGVDLQPGDRLIVTATGELQYADAQQPAGPDGLPRGWKDLLRILPINEAGRGALIGRIGDTDAARPFLIGARKEFSAPVAGRLFLSVNQTATDTGQGTLHATVQILQRAAPASTEKGQPASIAIADKVPAFTAALLEKIPRRIADAQGNAGDMTNFILLGSEERVRQAFEQAGWVSVDRTKKEAVLHGILASVTKQSYVQMPMSELYLFGRAQDYGFAQAEPFEVVLQRHHLRLWKAPLTAGGSAVWVGAGTHDIGLERDQRTPRGVTHKIDPDVDKERDYIGRSLSTTGLLSAMAYLTPAHPVGEEHTATGGSFHSDGRVLIMQLRGSSADRRAAFGALFCSVFEKERPDVGTWGPCADYIESPPSDRVAVGSIPTQYRLAIVPGVLSSCASAAPAYKEGQEHLRTAHGLTVDLLPAPNRSSAENGKDIAKFLKENYTKDHRKFIVLGYSKGAPDIMEGLAGDADALAAVSALVTVAGAVGGSPIADLLPAQAERWIKSVNLLECQGDVNSAFKSLRRDVRQSFLSLHPDLGVPVYSVAAISDKESTSKVLQENWQLMAVYAQQQDSQLVRTDAIYPGGNDLGAVRGDHWAVALPFEDSTDANMQKLVDRNHFPRTTLLEALVRLVTQDLTAAPKPSPALQ